MLPTLRTTGVILLLGLAACAPPPSPAAEQPVIAGRTGIDAQQLIDDVRILSADSMEGRAAGTPGGERARRYLLRRFGEIGLSRAGASFEQPFDFTRRDGASIRGVNLIGSIPGTARPQDYIVITAHYDHLGVRDGQIYPGADDNASGVAGLLALARHFREQPPRHSLIFAALDAEEMGLRGARAFVADPPVPRATIRFNINLDMVSRNEQGELYAVGTYHYPWLLPIVTRLAANAPVRLRTGHDRPDLPPGDDWTLLSDHGAFHEAGIPFLYFGVEDHPDYHHPTDTFANIDPDFFARAVETVRRVVRELDGGSLMDR